MIDELNQPEVIDELSKFEGCDKVLCIKSFSKFERGKIYSCYIINIENYLFLHIKRDGIFHCYDSLRTIESFCTLSEHRKKVIEDI